MARGVSQMSEPIKRAYQAHGAGPDPGDLPTNHLSYAEE